MNRRLPTLAALLAVALPLAAQEANESRELIGQLGGRTALVHLYAAKQADGAWRVNGEYVLLPTLQRRFLEGERSAQLGVLFLKEGLTPILYGREPSATLQGTWAGGVLKGTRYGPGGQERERFEFSESFPAMDAYTVTARCEAGDERYASALAYAIEAGKLRPGSFEWRSKLAGSGHGCAIPGEARVEQAAFAGGLRFSAGRRCAVTLRDLGDAVRVLAEDCAEFCASGGYLEPLLVDRRGGCVLLRPKS